ncbi:hypothetical protein DDZ14_02925 [Maritimibacter sp. 55A14]|uniref:hypothetical protein n=1 Tax=Maritimibacter sp. 55A14 TaxID=2174844 RepID=UPI000D61F385|nr:hypothetical protein [Maritimibacter sp. 55A14]PWE34123.1 hypothetical protein DDZ14_02925 [Maritimibacter sp. 55A14]
MKIFKGLLDQAVLECLSSNLGIGEYFSHVGNLVTLEKAIMVIGILSPDFVEHDGHIFWCSNAHEYQLNPHPLNGLKQNGKGKLEVSQDRYDVERYRNNFSINQFFSTWEESGDEKVFMVGLSKENYRLCHIFAERLEYYWREELVRHFPERTFDFEITDDLLDEYGVCLTFFQS